MPQVISHPPPHPHPRISAGLCNRIIIIIGSEGSFFSTGATVQGSLDRSYGPLPKLGLSVRFSLHIPQGLPPLRERTVDLFFSLLDSCCRFGVHLCIHAATSSHHWADLCCGGRDYPLNIPSWKAQRVSQCKQLRASNGGPSFVER